jgi:hypothetical protein
MLKSLVVGPKRGKPLSIDIATLAKRGRFKVHCALRNSPVHAPLDSLVLGDRDPIPVEVSDMDAINEKQMGSMPRLTKRSWRANLL